MNFLNYILSLFHHEEANHAANGAIPEEGVFGASFKEIVGAIDPVKWTEKPQKEWRKFPITNQASSGSCVAQTMAKLLGVGLWLKEKTYVQFSATPVYQRRTGKPTPGMTWGAAIEAAKAGVTLEALVPSQLMNDKQMDAVKIEPYKNEVGKVFAVSEGVVLPVGDIESVASVIQRTGKAVMVWFYGSTTEWTNVPTIKGKQFLSLANLRHSVAAVDFTLYKNQKALIIEDSWGEKTAMSGQRVITEDFFKARNYFAAYLMNFKFDSSGDRPHYTGTIVSFQDILKWEGFFPSNVGSTGFFGSVTEAAADKFCDKYGLPHTGRKITPEVDRFLRSHY